MSIRPFCLNVSVAFGFHVAPGIPLIYRLSFAAIGKWFSGLWCVRILKVKGLELLLERVLKPVVDSKGLKAGEARHGARVAGSV